MKYIKEMSLDELRDIVAESLQAIHTKLRDDQGFSCDVQICGSIESGNVRVLLIDSDVRGCGPDNGSVFVIED